MPDGALSRGLAQPKLGYQILCPAQRVLVPPRCFRAKQRPVPITSVII
jgi:hypothetical protein